MADETTPDPIVPAAEPVGSRPGDLVPDPNLPADFGSKAPDPEPETAKTRMRAFEDEHLGKDAVRIGGEVERGVGSPYASMKPEVKHVYEALERVVATEQKLADAKAAVLAAESDHVEAEAAVAAAEEKADAALAE